MLFSTAAASLSIPTSNAQEFPSPQIVPNAVISRGFLGEEVVIAILISIALRRLKWGAPRLMNIDSSRRVLSEEVTFDLDT